MSLLEVVVRHAWAQVMDVVETDIPSYPLQHFRQLVIRASLDRSFHIVPLALVFEIGVFKRMLHIEQPDSKDTGREHRRALNDQERFPTDERDDERIEHDERHVDQVCVVPFFFTCIFPVEPACDQNQEQRTETEHDERITIQTILQSSPSRCLDILFNRHDPNVTDTPLIQVPTRSVMNRMLSFPFLIWEQRENPHNRSDDGVRFLILEKRTVRTVVENDEHPDDESGCDDGERDSQEDRDLERLIGKDPGGKKRQNRIDHLPDALLHVGLFKRRDVLSELGDFFFTHVQLPPQLQTAMTTTKMKYETKYSMRLTSNVIVIRIYSPQNIITR